MKQEVVSTNDGTNTIHLPDLNENYHSGHGALQEAEHVFIQNGLNQFRGRNVVRVFEMGFGTGLNAILTYRWSCENSIKCFYAGIEAFPVNSSLISALNYKAFLNADESGVYNRMHTIEWGSNIHISDEFDFFKIQMKIEEHDMGSEQFDIIFFDAFGPRVNPELWSASIMNKMFEALSNDGMLVTYCAQGQFKRNLKSAGFEVIALPGPPGKREMTIGLKKQ